MADTRTQFQDRARSSGGLNRGRRGLRRLDAEALLRRGLVYALLTALGAAAYVLLVWGANLFAAAAIPVDSPLLIGGLAVLLAVVFHPLRERLQEAIDAAFFRSRMAHDERLNRFNQDLTRVSTLDEVLALIQGCLETTLAPARLHIFLNDPVTGQFAVFSPGKSAPAIDLRFTRDGPLAAHLAAAGAPVALEGAELPADLQPERARLTLLGSSLFVPIIGNGQLTGWFALSERLAGLPYTPSDLAFAGSLAERSALAVEQARVVSDLQRRVHEMNVLGRVAQGINVTLNFDDSLELIYAQTIQVVQVQHFRITLHDEITGELRHAFVIEDDDRLAEREGRTVPDGQGLEQVVARTGRAIKTDDYDAECRRRGAIPARHGLYAWLGIPLNAGERTIGALSLGSRDPSFAFTPDQQGIIQSIADQAAGAIIKTRLLEESERRTRQLEALNQVARSLTLELELDPLLGRVLESAVDIFGCEAGTLFLIDADTREIVFSVVVGGAEELVGTRLAPGTGLVGKSVDTRQPIIQNNVQQSVDWFGETDQDTGFTTRGLLVVPMQVRDEIIGVVELINKRDGSPFTQDDVRLLTAFSAQAAIAVQNARLFTMTDQALAARVEELSVMQRIDRELNASLDLGRVLHITLDWAVRQTGAEAGLVAVSEEGDPEVVDALGYPFDFESAGMRTRLADLDLVREALDQTQVRGVTGGPDRPGLLPESLSQVAVPFLRDRQPIGLLLLESRRPGLFAAESAEFLNRLSDHAAIAVANARFYSEVQEANIAKNDFISLVSHELKTPMTSIKGYADLLSAGAVGGINEVQAGFLATIRSNVDRMSTLVSDLTDVSRIEAGRLRLEYGAVPVREVVDEVVRTSGRQIEERKQELVLEIPDALPPVWGDRTRLVQVLSNLLSNAVKYTGQGGTVAIRAEVVGRSVDGAARGEAVRIAVIDNGIGIRPEDQAQVFTKFFRSDDQKAREVTGTGLGLNITRNLVEMQGGEVWFESEFRRGSRFYFTVPVAETT